MIENEFLESDVIVPIAHSKQDAVKIFMYYYSKQGVFQVQTTQMEHHFFEPSLNKRYFDKMQTVTVDGTKRRRKTRTFFFNLENMLRLKEYGKIYLQYEIAANNNNSKKSEKYKRSFNEAFKRYQFRLEHKFDEKIEYIRDLELLKKFDSVARRQLLNQYTVEAGLRAIENADAYRFEKISAEFDREFAARIHDEKVKIKNALAENCVQSVDLPIDLENTKCGRLYEI